MQSWSEQILGQDSEEQKALERLTNPQLVRASLLDLILLWSREIHVQSCIIGPGKTRTGCGGNVVSYDVARP